MNGRIRVGDSIPIMRDCKMTRLDLRTPLSTDESRGEGHYTLNAHFEFKDYPVDEITSGLTMRLTFDSSGNPYYSGEIAVNALFDFPSSFDNEARKRYLFKEGSAELYNAARMIAKTATAFGVFGQLDLPPFSVVDDLEVVE